MRSTNEISPAEAGLYVYGRGIRDNCGGVQVDDADVVPRATSTRRLTVEWDGIS
jgi:hypothetical protein